MPPSAGPQRALRRPRSPRGRVEAAPPRRDPAADHFQGSPGSRFENAGAAADAAVRVGAAGGRAAEGHGRALGRAAAAGVAPALLQPAAEAADDGEGRRGDAEMGTGWWGGVEVTGTERTRGSGGEKWGLKPGHEGQGM